MARLPSLIAQQAFEATARSLSVKAAAEELCVTSGAVSRQIKLLEEHFGVALLRRVGRGIALTAHGQAYAEDLRPGFDQLRRANEQLGVESSKVVIALRSYTTFATRWLIPRLASFHVANPDIEVRLSMSSQWMNLGEYDAAVRLGGGWPEYESMALVPNILIPVCSPQLAEVCRDDIAALTRLVLFTTPHRPDDWHLWLKAAGISNMSACSFVSFESSAVAIHSAINSEGVALAQRVLVEEDLRSGLLESPIDLAIDRGNHTYQLVWDANSSKKDAIKQLGMWLTCK